MPFGSFSLNIYSIHGCIVLCLLFFFIVTVNAKDMIGNLYFLLTSTRQKIILPFMGVLSWIYFFSFLCCLALHPSWKKIIAGLFCFPSKNTVLKQLKIEVEDIKKQKLVVSGSKQLLRNVSVLFKQSSTFR